MRCFFDKNYSRTYVLVSKICAKFQNYSIVWMRSESLFHLVFGIFSSKKTRQIRQTPISKFCVHNRLSIINSLTDTKNKNTKFYIARLNFARNWYWPINWPSSNKNDPISFLMQNALHIVVSKQFKRNFWLTSTLNRSLSAAWPCQQHTPSSCQAIYIYILSKRASYQTAAKFGAWVPNARHDVQVHVYVILIDIIFGS